ncbi:MAG TPA: glycosyltransferase [Phycisphaerae bacterium]|nr:glycosyltransferase [Phycisphaerae bacterium]
MLKRRGVGENLGMGDGGKIVLVITDLEMGGSPRWLRDLAVGLKREWGWAVEVVSLKALPVRGKSNGPTIAEQLQGAGIGVRSLGIRGAWGFWRGRRVLRRMLEESGAEVVYSVLVHANVLTALAMGRGRRRSAWRPAFVQGIHTLQRRPRWHWRAIGWAVKFADAMIVPSGAVLERVRRYGRVREGVVIPNGIDVERFARAVPVERVPWPEGAKVVGYVGRFDVVKNLDVLIRTVERMGDGVHLALVGYGAEGERLQGLAGELGIGGRVHFVGATGEPERWYRRFDCVCSASEEEGFGLMLVEAMAAGAPVVAVETAVTGEIVRSGVDGVLVRPPVDSGRLSEALGRVLGGKWREGAAPFSPTFAAGGGKSTQAWVAERFSVGGMVARHREFLEKIREGR